MPVGQRVEDGGKAKNWGLLVILGVFLLVALIRITGPTDIHRGDQWKQADYVVDIMVQGNWWVQHHNGDEIASKPPLYNWLAAPLMMVKGEPNDFLLKLPSLMAGLLTLVMVWDLVGRLMGWRVALYSGLFLVTSSMFAKQMYFARTDMLMVMLIVMQIWAATRWSLKTEQTPSYKDPWLWTVWVAGGLGMITKGPIVILMPHLVLAASWLWQGSLKSNYRHLGLGWGVPILLLPMVLWVSGVVLFEGWETLGLGYDKWVVTETVNRFDPSSEPGETRGLFYYLWPTIARSLPWSLFALMGLCWVPWRSLKKDPTPQNKGLVLAICWIVTLLVMLSVVPSKRIVRIFPVIPAICLLAGWGYNRLLEKYRSRSVTVSKEILLGSMLVGVVIVGIGLDKHIFSEPTRRPDIAFAQKLSKALRIEAKAAHAEILVHSGLSQPWRYFLLQTQGAKSNEQITELFKASEHNSFYVVGKQQDLESLENQVLAQGLGSVEWTEKVGNISIEAGVGVVHLLRKEQ